MVFHITQTLPRMNISMDHVKRIVNTATYKSSFIISKRNPVVTPSGRRMYIIKGDTIHVVKNHHNELSM